MSLNVASENFDALLILGLKVCDLVNITGWQRVLALSDVVDRQNKSLICTSNDVTEDTTFKAKNIQFLEAKDAMSCRRQHHSPGQGQTNRGQRPKTRLRDNHDVISKIFWRQIILQFGGKMISILDGKILQNLFFCGILL